MNGLIQQKSLLIGTQEEIDKLATQESARILVISDSHGDKQTFQKILKSEGMNSNALVFCGDGASDLFFCLEEAQTNESFMKYIPPVIAFAEGNGDSNIYPVKFDVTGNKKKQSALFYSNVSVPLEQILRAAGHNIFISHGHRYDVYYGTEMIASRAKALGAQIALYGHTHISASEDRNGILVLNPGSCSRPRGGQTPSYAVVSLTSKPASYNYKIIPLC